MQTAIRWALCLLGIEVILGLSVWAGLIAIVPLLAASYLLLVVNPQRMFSRPRTVLLAYLVIGHLSLLNSVFFGHNLFGILVTTVLAIVFMAVTPCIHLPALVLPFLLAHSSTPFRMYFLILGLVGVVLGLHLMGQWLIDQLYKKGQSDSPVLTGSKPRLALPLPALTAGSTHQ